MEVRFYHELKQAFAHHAQIMIIESDVPVNAFSLSLRAEAALVWATTMAYELPCYGIPVIEGGGWPLESLPFLAHLKDSHVLAATKEAIVQHEAHWKTNAQLALRYFFAMSFRCLFNVSAIDWDVWHTVRLKQLTLSEIGNRYQYEIGRLLDWLEGNLDDFAIDVDQQHAIEPVRWSNETAFINYLIERYRS